MLSQGWAFLGPVARQPLPVTENTLFYRFYGCGRGTFVTSIGAPFPLKSPAPDILPPGQRKPAAGAHHQSSVSTMRPITRYFCASKR